MLTSLIVGAILLTGPAGAADECAAGGVMTASLLDDLRGALQLVLPIPGWTASPPPPTPYRGLDCDRPGVQGACAARSSVLEQTERHERLVRERGVGAWYGDASAYYKLSDEERQAWIEAHTKPGQTPASPAELNRSSCVEWAMEHVRAYYESIGDLATWARIEEAVRGERLTGTSLARELKAAGWKSIYLNADGHYQGVTERDGEHVFSKAVVQSDGTYYGTPVDESILDWEADPDRLAGLERQPFFVYVARGGLHVTAGVDGKINELARGEGPSSKVIYQDRLMDIVDVYTGDVYGGGDEGRQKAMRMWGSGLVLLPPTSGD